MLPKRGRPGQALLLSVEAPLTRNDLARLALGLGLPKIAPPLIQRLRAVHHMMARHLAAGRSITEVATLVNYTPQRVGDLSRDPTFQDLMMFYEEQINEGSLDRLEKAKALELDIADLAGEEILGRLEDPKLRTEIPTGELRQLKDSALNRIGLPAQTAVSAPPVPIKMTFNMGGRGLREVPASQSKEIDHEDP